MKLSDVFDCYEDFEIRCSQYLKWFERNPNEDTALFHFTEKQLVVMVDYTDEPKFIKRYDVKIPNPFNIDNGGVRFSSPLNYIKWNIINLIGEVK